MDEDIGAGDGARVLIGKGIGSGIGDVVEGDGEAGKPDIGKSIRIFLKYFFLNTINLLELLVFNGISAAGRLRRPLFSSEIYI